mgnify:CR=1 FL=1
MCIQWTRVLFSVVIPRQSNPPISQFNCPCNKFTWVWSLFVLIAKSMCLFGRTPPLHFVRHQRMTKFDPRLQYIAPYNSLRVSNFHRVPKTTALMILQISINLNQWHKRAAKGTRSLKWVYVSDVWRPCTINQSWFSPTSNMFYKGYSMLTV